MDNFENSNEHKSGGIRMGASVMGKKTGGTKSYNNFVAQTKKDMKVLLLFTLIFSIVCVVLGFFIVDIYLDVQVAKNGTLAQAVVLDSDYHSGDDDSDPYWTIYYSYEFEGKIYKDSYSSDYNETRGTKVWIKHDGAGRSVIATHSTSFIGSALVLLIVFVLFGLAVCVWIVGFFITMHKVAIHKKMEEGNCQFATATYVSGYTAPGVAAHVKYMYEDSEGAIHEGKSLEKYSSEKLLYFQNKGTFEIKYVGKYSTIIEKEETQATKEEEIIVRNGAARCSYCQTIIPAGSPECPNCKAKRDF